MTTVNEYFNNDEMRSDVFKSKYSQHDDQTIEECFGNITKSISEVTTEIDGDYWNDRWLSELMEGIWRPGGSIIASVNNPTKNISIFNCTTFVIEEDTLESIYQTRTEAAKAAAYRQGLGIEFSNIRPAGTPINNSAEESDGVINWMLSFNNIANEVGQKGRKPALLGSLKITHPDIIKFIKVKSDLDTLKNMNISVQITDEFMTCLKEDGIWTMQFELHTGQIIKDSIKANDLFTLICEQSHSFAEPGVQFIDLMKQYSIQEALGYEITSTNAPVIGNSLVATDIGLCKIEKLYNQNNVNVLVDTKHFKPIDRFNYGEMSYVPATFNKYTNQPLYEIKLSNNQVLQCNDEHEWLTDTGYKKTNKLTSDDKLMLPSDGIWTQELSDSDIISSGYQDGLLVGWFVGDGFYTTTYKSKGVPNKRKSIGLIWSADDNDIYSIFQHKYKELTGKDFNYIRDRESCFETRTNHESIYNWFNSFGFDGCDKYIIPERCFTDRVFAAGFIAGLLGADGHVTKDFYSIILTTVSNEIASKLQLLLSAFGIYVSYVKSKQVPCNYTLKDGTELLSNCKPFRYDLTMGNFKSQSRLFTRVGIFNDNKYNLIKENLENGIKKYPTNLSINIESVEFTGNYVDMYCANVPDVHGVIIDGILSSNCSEKSLPNRGVCCLSSLNMAEVPHIDSHKFHDFMEDKVYSLVRFMDNVVQYEIDNPFKSPLAKQMEVVKDLREIGIGITNLHQWLYDQGVAYDSEQGTILTGEFFKWYQYYAFKASTQLAEDRGPCPAWSRHKDNLVETKFLTNLFKEFPDLKKLFYTVGIRNGALLSVAPTGSISMTFPLDCLSNGIEPSIGYAFWRKTRAVSRGDYDYYFVLPTSVKHIILDAMTNGSDVVDSHEYDLIATYPSSKLDNDGKIGLEMMKIINKWIDVQLLPPAHQIDPFNKVKMMGQVQRWVDAAISVTYNLPEDFPVDGIKDLYINAYNEDIKALSVYRDGSREGIYIFEDPITHRAKYTGNNKVTLCKDRPSEIEFHCSPKRPTELECEIHHCTVKGEQWIVLVGMYNDNPYEIFAGMKNEDFNISKNIKEGTIIKKKEKYTLRVPFRNSYIEYSEITSLFMNDEFKALTRMISLALRHGVYHEFITNQLKKSSDFVGDFMAVVSRVLNKYIGNTSIVTDKVCPECGEGLVNEAGCLKCSTCIWSKCE